MQWTKPCRVATTRAGRNIGAALALASLLAAGNPAGASGRPAYPRELHGFWIPAGATCPDAGQSYDGDLMMDIAADRLLGYEEASRPLKVVALSRVPKAWKVESSLDIGPSGVHEKAAPQIFVLGKRMLTVVDEENARVFRRCALDN